jgi:hypothetical protein
LVRGPGTQVIVLATLFLGGGVAGAGLSHWLAPDSWAAQFVGLFSLSLPFAIGMNLWLGFAITTELWRAVRRRGRPARGAAAPVPPGAIAFVPTCVVLVGFAGILIAILGSSLGVVLTVALYLALGLLYGIACWLYARNGYLPFPHE